MEKVEKNDFGEVQVEISEDDMEAYITLTPEKRDQVFQMDELKILLKAAGVEYGVLEDVLQKAVSEKRYYEQFTVARGEEPVDGKDGWFEFLFPIHVDTRPKILKDGSVDYTSFIIIRHRRRRMGRMFWDRSFRDVMAEILRGCGARDLNSHRIIWFIPLNLPVRQRIKMIF